MIAASNPPHPTPQIAFTDSLARNIELLLAALGYDPVVGPLEWITIYHGGGDSLGVSGTDRPRAIFIALVHYLVCRQLNLALADVEYLRREWKGEDIRLSPATRAEFVTFLADQWPAHDPTHWIVCWFGAHWDQGPLDVRIMRFR